MLRADEDAESEPLLKNPPNTPRLWRSLTISDEDDIYKQKEAAREVKVQYEPKVSLFSPHKLAIVLCVLLVELCERMSYYGVVANLVLFCESVLKYTSTEATDISLIFSGTVYLIPIIGGYVADAWSSRFNVIYGSGLVYFCGKYFERNIHIGLVVISFVMVC